MNKETLERRFESKAHFDAAKRVSDPYYQSVTAYLAVRKPNQPLETIELDEDSFWLAYSNWSVFVEHALGAYAADNADRIATVYTYGTGPSPSRNSSHGELHQERGWHNAVFFGVVGRHEVLEVARRALAHGDGVPDAVVGSGTVDLGKVPQIYCGQSPDFIDFRGRGLPAYHIEDGLVWRPEEQFLWYTNPDWRPTV